MLNNIEIEKLRENFFNLAKNFELDTSSSSPILPILDFVFKSKIDTLNEIYSISTNYNIQKAKGDFLDIEAYKIGLTRNLAKTTVLTCKLNIKDDGYLPQNTYFHHDGLRFKTTTNINFKKDKEYLINLEAEEKGFKFNIKTGSVLFTNENISGLISLEVIKIVIEGKDNENDDDFRNRILKTIPTFTLRDSKNYYEGKIVEREEIKEVFIVRTPNGEANSMKIIIRPLNQSTDLTILKKIVVEQVEKELPALVKLDFVKAEEDIVNIKLVPLTDNINKEEKITDIKRYFNGLKLGDTFNIADLYDILGRNINMTEPVENRTTSKNKFFVPNIEFKES